MTTETEYKVVQGPDRLKLSVSLFYVGNHGNHEAVRFKTEPPWSPHTDEVEVDVMSVKAVSRVMGRWEIVGVHPYNESSHVCVEYSTHTRKGTLRFVPGKYKPH